MKVFHVRSFNKKTIINYVDDNGVLKFKIGIGISSTIKKIFEEAQKWQIKKK